MTAQKEHEDGKEGILEQMLRRLTLIGRNVERIVYRFDFYNSPRGQEDDEWTAEDSYENGDY